MLQAARSILDRMDSAHRSQRPGEPELDARIANYELAARMQMAATDALDLSRESPATLEMYGLNDELTASYGRRCLMARRLVERGVRFVQIYIEFQIWDHHSAIERRMHYTCGKTDKPVCALLTDLKQRGLLDSTLVVWGGRVRAAPTVPGQRARSKRAGGPGPWSLRVQCVASRGRSEGWNGLRCHRRHRPQSR